MTIEQLLECSADELRAMSDDELLKHFAPYLTVTRPEIAKVQKQEKSTIITGRSSVKKSDAADVARDILKQFNLPISF